MVYVGHGILRINEEQYNIEITELQKERDESSEILLDKALTLTIACAEGVMSKAFGIEIKNVINPEEVVKKICGEATDLVLKDIKLGEKLSRKNF